MKLSSLLPARFRKTALVIPVVRLQGMISPSGSPLRQNLSLANVAGPLERAFTMKQAPAVALVINSPGGSPVQSRLIHDRIRQLADQHGKRVLVFVEDVAASGGYMIALAGDEIIADETSIVGSIGVVSAGFGFVDAIHRLGIERRVHTAGTNKAILDPFQPERSEDVEHLKSIQREMHAVFIDMVRKSRGNRLVDDGQLFSGLFWTGATARQLGLIDSCGLLGPVIAERYGKKAELKLVQPKRSLFGRAQPGIGVAAPAEASGPFGQLAESLPEAIIANVEERLARQRYGL